MGARETRETPVGDAYQDLRPYMFAIAYRMVGSVSDAEDIVQEAFLRFHRVTSEGEVVESPKAYLSAVTTRLGIDHLRSARVRRESYVGQWLPEPLITDQGSDVAQHAETADSLSLAFLVLLESLSPVERAVFLLRDVFGYGYGEIARVVDKSEENCRQIAVRARRWMRRSRDSKLHDRERKSWPGGSSPRPRRGTWMDCSVCSPPTSSRTATAGARRPRSPGPSSAETGSPGCWPASEIGPKSSA